MSMAVSLYVSSIIKPIHLLPAIKRCNIRMKLLAFLTRLFHVWYIMLCEAGDECLEWETLATLQLKTTMIRKLVCFILLLWPGLQSRSLTYHSFSHILMTSTTLSSWHFNLARNLWCGPILTPSLFTSVPQITRRHNLPLIFFTIARWANCQVVCLNFLGMQFHVT